jgi:hypothetical protein
MFARTSYKVNGFIIKPNYRFQYTKIFIFKNLLKLCCYGNTKWFNPLPLLFKSLLPGQEDCVFFNGHLNLHAKPETGIPYREKNYNN